MLYSNPTQTQQQMAISISFFLVYSKKKISNERLHDTPVSIRAQVRFTRSHLNWSAARRFGHEIRRIQFTTGVQAQPRLWANGKVKHTHTNAATINATLDAIADRAIAAHAAYIEAGEFPNDTDFMAAMLGAKEAAAPTAGFFERYEQFIGYMADKGIHSTTRTGHRLILKNLKKFTQETGYNLTFDTINKTFAAKYAAWMLRQPIVRKNQNPTSTAQRHLKEMRNFLSHAHGEEWTTATAWRKIHPQIPKPKFPLTVTADEIARIWALTPGDFKHRYPRHTAQQSAIVTRDWFIFGTQTAMRWIDWHTKKYRFIPLPDGQYNLQFVQHKTDDPVEIPLSTLAIQILQKYNFAMPPPFTPGGTLKHLTAIAAAAHIPKHITSHTARRTFCTLQEAAGVPRGVIMRITGHRTERQYLRYTGITYRVNADLMRRANPDMFKTAG